MPCLISFLTKMRSIAFSDSKFTVVEIRAYTKFSSIPGLRGFPIVLQC